ncbi:MAG: FAD-dependent oxidoreductase [Planctomycetaceae bacterium]|nr:FAD-dependent oxidoreductase [Planctomycetaceae bacterium]
MAYLIRHAQVLSRNLLFSLIATWILSGLPILAQSEDRQVDLIVYGGTPGGIACAVRAAREGLQVDLISPYAHLGGMLSNGLSTMDTLYNGSRSPLYDEFRTSIYDYYRDQYGENSPEYLATQPGFAKTRYEAHVVEQLFERMLSQEERITIHREWFPIEVVIENRLITSVVFRQRKNKALWTVQAPVFADCSYEGDLFAVAKIPYRAGRESREEFGEKHAGMIYVREHDWPPANSEDRIWQLARKLNLERITFYPSAIEAT